MSKTVKFRSESISTWLRINKKEQMFKTLSKEDKVLFKRHIEDTVKQEDLSKIKWIMLSEGRIVFVFFKKS